MTTKNITLDPLPFEKNALEPFMSNETVEFHYEKHHRGYVEKLQRLVQDTKFIDMNLDDIVRKSDGAIFNNAAQHWNHRFFWNCLRAPSQIPPGTRLAAALEQNFGGLKSFQDQFLTDAKNLFGSGWVWLVKDADLKLKIQALSNAENPLTKGCVPLLVLDVWEHAYYIDYRNERERFVKGWWNIVNWDFVESHLIDF